MKIKLLTASTALKEIILKNLHEFNLTADVIDSNLPLHPQLKDVEILVNSSSKVDRSIIDAAPNLRMIHQSGIGIDNIDVNIIKDCQIPIFCLKVRIWWKIRYYDCIESSITC